MPIFKAIVAMAENRAIAYQNKLPWHLPLEYRWFKHQTMGGALIMGRKTCEAIGKALPGRTSYVLSKNGGECLGVKCYPTIERLCAALPDDQPAWVVGGAEIYRQFLPRCALIYLSKIKRTTPGDVFFPPFEDKFALDQVIHENDDFRVERWAAKEKGHPTVPTEKWPF